ncbi:hypothetical protein ACQPW1_09710 [Nocardia sp. CA-128927]|uniref:hypothetical protein n=1 Tax=Nocardia sp. CA-128927 TaxID=3239975 RepID=UPI003D98175C
MRGVVDVARSAAKELAVEASMLSVRLPGDAAPQPAAVDQHPAMPRPTRWADETD